MQDVRIRTAAAILLSFVAFMSVTGAALGLVWWLIFTPNIRILKVNHLFIPSIVMIGFFSLVLQILGSDGLSYFFRMLVIILLGCWLLAEQKPGEFLHLGCWLFGPRTGFELGLIAEMALQNLAFLSTDFDRIRTAERMKGIRTGIPSIIPAVRVLLHRTLLRAGDTAEQLAIRGYIHGGTFTPVFIRDTRDRVAGFCALCAGIIAMIPVSAFFILS